MAKLWVVTFYTEGEPYDRGLDLRGEAMEFQALVSPHVNEYLTFCPRTLLAEYPDAAATVADYSGWLESHPRRREVERVEPIWARTGFLAWKPYLVRRVLARDEVAEGDIILYHDMNVRKYPQYRLHMHEWGSLAVALLEELGTDMYCPLGMPMKYDTKSFLIRRYLGPVSDWAEQFGVWAGLVVLRKSATSRTFVDDWFTLCSDLDNISPVPNPDPHPEFVWHSVDQSVMGVLAAIWRNDGRLPERWPRYAVVRRTFGWRWIVEVRPQSSPAAQESSPAVPAEHA